MNVTVRDNLFVSHSFLDGTVLTRTQVPGLLGGTKMLTNRTVGIPMRGIRSIERCTPPCTRL